MAACWSDRARVFLDTPTDGAGDALTDSAHGRLLAHRALLALYRPEWLVGADSIGDEAWREAGAGPTHMWRRSSGHGGELHPDLFLLLSTSGSTGSPKLVRLTQGAVEANAVGHDAQVGD